MRPNEIKEEYKDRDHGIGRFKRVKATFCFVPRFEAVVKGFNEIVADIVLKALYTNMGRVREETLYRHLVGRIAVADNGGRVAHMGNLAEQRMCLWRITMGRQMKAQNKAGFAVYDEPDVMFFAIDFNNGFISMPFVRIKIHHRNQLKRNAFKYRSKLFAPVSDSNMRNFNVEKLIENQRDISCRAFANEELIQSCNDQKG